MPCSSSPNASCSSSTGKTSSNAKEPFDTICGAVGKNYSSGFFTGNKKDSDRTYLFATRDTMSRHYEEFSADSFDYIVIDEAHQPDWPIKKKTLLLLARIQLKKISFTVIVFVFFIDSLNNVFGILNSLVEIHLKNLR